MSDVKSRNPDAIAAQDNNTEGRHHMRLEHVGGSLDKIPLGLCRSFLRFPVALLALIALLGAWPRDVRANGCKLNDQQCATSVSCCTGNCQKPTIQHGRARFGLCCPAGNVLCAAACTDTGSDSNNCGACGTVCPGGGVCS